MKILAFQGTRYSKKNGEPGQFAAPPYDQIDDDLRDRLQRNPFNFAHLLRPGSRAELSPFEHAASLHQEWQATGTVENDQALCLYPCEIELASGGRRLGLTALVKIEEPEQGIIRPHEQTVDKTVEERLRLLRAMQADIGPVLLLSEDGGELDPLLSKDIAELSPLAEHADAHGNLHRLYRIDDHRQVRRYQELLQPCAGLIADGHHRYRVASLYGREIGASSGTAAASKLAVITSLDSQGLAIDPGHRAFRDPVGLDSPSASVLERQPVDVRNGSELAAAVAVSKQPAVGVVGTMQSPEIWILDPETGPPHLPRAASDLAVVLLHLSLFPVWGLESNAAIDGTVLYRSDADVLWQSVEQQEVGAAFFLPPMSPSGFAAAIANGDILPPKSTRFLPKLVSGLVWASHDAEVG
jgi:uncharacterized protein (DUF1015 family)